MSLGAKSAGPDSRAQKRSGRLGRLLWFLAKLLVAGAASAYILLRQPWSDLRAALADLSLAAMAASMLLMCMTVVLGTIRLRFMMSAYGADRRPPFLHMLRVYFVGQFYNTYVPGAVGGDVLRGVVTRSSFAQGGATAAVAIVFVERALGLLGVVSVTAFAVPFAAQGSLGRAFLPYCAAGALAVLGLVVAVAQGRRVAHYLPQRIAYVLRSLPVLRSYGPFGAAVLLSIMNQITIGFVGHLLISSVYPKATLGISLLAMPIAAGAGFFPLSFAGAGPRDAVLGLVYAALGVPKAPGSATALGFLVCMLIVSGLGGILQLMAPLVETSNTEPGGPQPAARPPAP